MATKAAKERIEEIQHPDQLIPGAWVVVVRWREGAGGGGNIGSVFKVRGVSFPFVAATDWNRRVVVFDLRNTLLARPTMEYVRAVRPKKGQKPPEIEKAASQRLGFTDIWSKYLAGLTYGPYADNTDDDDDDDDDEEGEE